MSCLIVQAPAHPQQLQDLDKQAIAAWPYVLLSANGDLLTEGAKPVANLPPAADCTLVLPWQALSWHRLSWAPLRRLRDAKLRLALENLLEERLLQNPQDVHFAPGPALGTGEERWVGVCDRSWLEQLLRQLGRKVHAVVAPFWPQDDASGAVKHLLWGTEDNCHWIRVSAQAPLIKPLPPGRWRNDGNSEAWLQLRSQLQEADVLWTQAACAPSAEMLLPGKVQLQTQARYWQEQQALNWGGWNWAALELQAFSSRHWRQRFQDSWKTALKTVFQAPAWRGFRWGLVALLLVHGMGYGLWHWHMVQTRKQLQTQMQQLLLRTFPQVKTVVNAPLQMQQELARLQNQHGQLNAQDFESLLAALGHESMRHALQNWQLQEVHYSQGRLSGTFSRSLDTPQQAMQQELRCGNHSCLLRVDAQGRWTLQLDTPNTASPHNNPPPPQMNDMQSLQAMQVAAQSAQLLQSRSAHLLNAEDQAIALKKAVAQHAGVGAEVQALSGSPSGPLGPSGQWRVRFDNITPQALAHTLQSVRQQALLLPQQVDLKAEYGPAGLRWSGQWIHTTRP